MLEKFLKKAYNTLLINWVVPFLMKWPKLKPIHITIAALVSGLIGALFIIAGFSWSALTLILFSGYLDTLDGPFARATHKTSNSGCVCDIVSDRTVEAAIIIAFYLRFGHGAMCLFMLAATLVCVTSFLVVSMFLSNDSEKSFKYSHGIVQRGEAFMFFSAMLIFENWHAYLGWIYVILVFLSAGIRLKQFIEHETIEHNVVG